MATLEVELGDLRASKVEFVASDLIVTLRDGRRIATPIAWYPRLANATEEQRLNYQIMPMGIHWPDLDEDLSIAGMFAGSPAAGVAVTGADDEMPVTGTPIGFGPQVVRSAAQRPMVRQAGISASYAYLESRAASADVQSEVRAGNDMESVMNSIRRIIEDDSSSNEAPLESASPSEEFRYSTKLARRRFIVVAALAGLSAFAASVAAIGIIAIWLR